MLLLPCEFQHSTFLTHFNAIMDDTAGKKTCYKSGRFSMNSAETKSYHYLALYLMLYAVG